MSVETDGAAGGDLDPERASVPWRSRTVQVVLLSTALAPLGVPLISPALPAFPTRSG